MPENDGFWDVECRIYVITQWTDFNQTNLVSFFFMITQNLEVSLRDR